MTLFCTHDGSIVTADGVMVDYVRSAFDVRRFMLPLYVPPLTYVVPPMTPPTTAEVCREAEHMRAIELLTDAGHPVATVCIAAEAHPAVVVYQGRTFAQTCGRYYEVRSVTVEGPPGAHIPPQIEARIGELRDYGWTAGETWSLLHSQWKRTYPEAK